MTKNNTDLYIICAGKGSRMDINIPKALVNITDDPCLTTTLQQIGNLFDNVFIVTDYSVQDKWTEYFDNLQNRYPSLCTNVINVPIRSGYGDGHAVLEALNDVSDFNFSGNNDIVVCWGDVFFQYSETVKELLSKKINADYSGIIPVVNEKNPYVAILTENQNYHDDVIISADFSKYGETNDYGYHDQSVFRFNKTHLKAALETLHVCLWKNDKYATQGGELSLLYAFHYLYNIHTPVSVYATEYPTLSFNTKEEVQHIQMHISETWNKSLENK